MRFVVPIILIIVGFGLFFMYIDPTYGRIEELQAERDTFNEALDKADELLEVRDRLLDTYNSFTNEELSRLKKLLPDHVDSVRLIIDIDGIAAQYGLRIEDVEVGSTNEGNEGENVGIAELKFTIEAPYATLKQFLMDLEDSLRLIDVAAVSFTSEDTDDTIYRITIRTYWLK